MASTKYFPFKNDIAFYERNWPYTSYLIFAAGRIKVPIGLAWATYGLIVGILLIIGGWIAVTTPYVGGETIENPGIERFSFLLGTLWFVFVPMILAFLTLLVMGLGYIFGGWRQALRGKRVDE